MADLEIIGVPFSNYVRAIRMLCEEKGVPYKHNPAMPHSPDVKAISPTGQVPVMRHGDVALYESKAIATYIDRAFGGPKLIPEDALGAAKLEQWVSFGNVKVDRWIMREFVVPSVFFDKAKGPDTAKIAAAVPEIEKCAKVLEEGVSKTGYLVGNALTYADLNVAPMLAALSSFPQGKEILAKSPKLSAYLAKLTERPSYTKTAPPPRKA
jgi:glutathione S-transferase